MRDTVRLLLDDTTGFTGVGHLTANYSPQNKLHIHDTLTGGSAYLQITNRATGTTPIDSRGVRLGLDNGGTVQLINGSTGNPTETGFQPKLKFRNI